MRYYDNVVEIIGDTPLVKLNRVTEGIEATVLWYLDNDEWVRNVTSGAYRDWVAEQYA